MSYFSRTAQGAPSYAYGPEYILNSVWTPPDSPYPLETVERQSGELDQLISLLHYREIFTWDSSKTYLYNHLNTMGGELGATPPNCDMCGQSCCDNVLIAGQVWALNPLTAQMPVDYSRLFAQSLKWTGDVVRPHGGYYYRRNDPMPSGTVGFTNQARLCAQMAYYPNINHSVLQDLPNYFDDFGRARQLPRFDVCSGSAPSLPVRDFILIEHQSGCTAPVSLNSPAPDPIDCSQAKYLCSTWEIHVYAVSQDRKPLGLVGIIIGTNGHVGDNGGLQRVTQGIISCSSDFGTP